MTRSHKAHGSLNSGTSGEYMIVVRGEMDESMSDWLDGMKVTLSSPAGDPEVTTLVGRLRDQAALRGVVETLYEFHFPILSIERIGD